MVVDKVSPSKIRNYLHRWSQWWTNSSGTWQYSELLQWFVDTSWTEGVTAYAMTLKQLYFNKLHTRASALDAVMM